LGKCQRDVRTLEFEASAKRDLARLPKADATDILIGIEAYVASGIGDVKKLKAYTPPTWRLRIGEFRVLYQRRESTIVITRIRDRRDVYRR
jgi:mRNA interferase RelE/StbE